MKSDLKHVSTSAPVHNDLERLPVESTVPLYEVVKRQISERIVSGVWPPGMVIPSEVALANTLGVAVGTVRRALVDLAAEGIITRRRKIGTVVTGRSAHHSLSSFFQYFRLHTKEGALLHSHAVVLGVKEIELEGRVAAKLELDEGTRAFQLDRLREVDGVPIMLDHFIFEAARTPDFPIEASKVPELFYMFLLERYGIRISAVREELSADLATSDEAKLLKLPSPSAILKIEEVAFDQAGVPTLYGIRRATTQSHVYINEIR